ncbi:MAG: ankyrin repeat domain-containing protein [Alphaproteobacteria bacterium]|nr:ankyrin repeat domain-containing protein [Alphaproteobacteria bacterium]
MSVLETIIRFFRKDKSEQALKINAGKDAAKIEKSPIQTSLSDKVSLITAVHDGQLDEVRRLIAEGVDINAVDEHGNTALMYAAKKGFSLTIEALVKAGADVNFQKSEVGITALSFAAMKGFERSIEKLVNAGADIEVQDYKGNTPLILAAIYGNTRSVAFLISKGCHINAQTKSGYTALMLAAKHGFYDTVKLLINAGADTTMKDKLGKTALIHASEHNYSTCEELLKSCAQKASSASSRRRVSRHSSDKMSKRNSGMQYQKS